MNVRCFFLCCYGKYSNNVWKLNWSSFCCKTKYPIMDMGQYMTRGYFDWLLLSNFFCDNQYSICQNTKSSLNVILILISSVNLLLLMWKGEKFKASVAVIFLLEKNHHLETKMPSFCVARRLKIHSLRMELERMKKQLICDFFRMGKFVFDVTSDCQLS